MVDQMATQDDVIIRGALEEYIEATDNKRAGYAIGKIVGALGKILDDQNRRIQKAETVISRKLAP
jgi:hypothetical protein